MKNKWKTVIAWLAGLAGLSSCDSIDTPIIGSGALMYGTPYADYDVNIVVTDEDGKPIKGISVHESWPGGQEMAKTGADGKAKFYMERNSFCRMYLEDVDGEANGGDFEGMPISDKDLSLKQTKKGDKSWYNGRYEATGTVKMTKKK